MIGPAMRRWPGYAFAALAVVLLWGCPAAASIPRPEPRILSASSGTENAGNFPVTVAAAVRAPWNFSVPP